MSFPQNRMRRLRRTEPLRALVRETTLEPGDLIYPLFLCPGKGVRNPISSMPGVFNLSVDEAVREAEEAAQLGIGGLLLFGLPDAKDEQATGAWDENGIVQQGLRALKQSSAAQEARPHRRRLPLRIHQPRPLRRHRQKSGDGFDVDNDPIARICSPAPQPASPAPEPTSSLPAT